MSNVVEIKNIEDLKRFRLHLQSIKIQSLQFQMITLNKLANNLVLDKIHQNMRASGFSESIIENTIISKVEHISNNKARVHFRSELFAETGYDIALGREEGTDGHFIEPKNPKTGPKALHGGSEWPYFSKKHWVDGIPALFIIRDTVREMAQLFQDEYNKELNSWISENLK